MKDWVKSVIVGIVGGLFGGLMGGALGLLVLAIALKNYNAFGNVADWLSGIGTFGAILMVLFQIRKDKESTFSQSRPFFKINYEVEKISQKTNKVYYDNLKDNNSQIKKTSFDYQLIEIKNISPKRMLAVQVTIFAKKINYNHETKIQEKKLEFKIDSITPDESVNLILRNLSKVCNFEYAPTFEYYDFDNLTIYFTTELREKIKLIFKKEGESLIYKKHFIENKGDKISEKEYSLNDFKESKILNN